MAKSEIQKYSMRSTMFTSHLKQFVNLLEPEYPLVFTNAENVVGKYSNAYKRVKHKCKVYKKIAKFEDILDEPLTYKLFIFDEKTKKFDVITRKVCEDLTENFGFDYNNEEIDKYDDGDIIPADTVLYKSTSYDEDMNYAYGRNVNVMYTLDPFTSEDAAKASKSLAKALSSIETEVITIGLNDNDYFINLQGENETWSLVPDKKGKYKPLPEIGEDAQGSPIPVLLVEAGFDEGFGGIAVAGRFCTADTLDGVALHVLMAAYFVHLAIRALYLTLRYPKSIPTESLYP